MRDLPPRDVVHIWTVDRHLVETVSRASAFTTRVSRPDLLVLGALVHDIGKGRGGDHSVIGAELATQIGTRLGLWPSDVELLSKIVRYHLLLPDTATRRDLQDPKTIASVVDALGGDPVLLELLHVLAEADSLATGPGVWGDWKASLIGDLVRRCRLVMAGEPLPQPDPIDPRYLSLAAEVGVHVELTPGDSPHIYNVTMIAPDRRGPAVQGGRRAGAELAAGAFGVGQQPRGRRRSTPSWCHRISVRRRPPSCCASSSSWPSTVSSTSSRRWNAVTATPRSTARRGPGRCRAAVPINHVAGAAAGPVVRRHRAGRAGRPDPRHRPRRSAGEAHRGVRARRRGHRVGQGHHAGLVGASTCSASWCPPWRPATVRRALERAAVRDELERDLYAVLPTPAPAKPVSEAS